jgi:hypothetical protein
MRAAFSSTAASQSSLRSNQAMRHEAAQETGTAVCTRTPRAAEVAALSPKALAPIAAFRIGAA